MATQWPRNAHAMPTEWPRNGHGMATEWPRHVEITMDLELSAEARAFVDRVERFARERVAVTGVQEVERRHRHQEGRTSRKASPHAVVNERASFVGKASAAKLQRRLTELHAAGVVGELVIGRPHPLEYDRAGQFTIMWNDPALNIPWPARRPILSRRDAGKEDV